MFGLFCPGIFRLIYIYIYVSPLALPITVHISPNKTNIRKTLSSSSVSSHRSRRLSLLARPIALIRHTRFRALIDYDVARTGGRGAQGKLSCFCVLRTRNVRKGGKTKKN